MQQLELEQHVDFNWIGHYLALLYQLSLHKTLIYYQHYSVAYSYLTSQLNLWLKVCSIYAATLSSHFPPQLSKIVYIQPYKYVYICIHSHFQPQLSKIVYICVYVCKYKYKYIYILTKTTLLFRPSCQSLYCVMRWAPIISL